MDFDYLCEDSLPLHYRNMFFPSIKHFIAVFSSVGIFENMCFKPKHFLTEAQINDCQKRRFAKRRVIIFPRSKLETRNWMVCEGVSSSYRCYILEGIMFQVPAANRSFSNSCFGVCIYLIIYNLLIFNIHIRIGVYII